MMTNAKKALQREIELAEWMLAECQKKVVGGNSSMLHDYATYQFMLDALRRIEAAMHDDEFPYKNCPF